MKKVLLKSKVIYTILQRQQRIQKQAKQNANTQNPLASVHKRRNGNGTLRRIVFMGGAKRRA